MNDGPPGGRSARKEVIGESLTILRMHPGRKGELPFEPWHYVPLLDRKPGALRNGAPFVDWQLPDAMHRIREHYMAGKGGDREFVDLLLLAQDHGIEVVEFACDLAVEQNTLRLPAIVNLINQLVEPVITPLGEPYTYSQLTLRPEADCKRYEALYSAEAAAA